MTERRTKRSGCPEQALQFLLETTADRGKLRALALLNDQGRVLAGTGAPHDVGGLARRTRAARRGEDYAEGQPFERGADFLLRDFSVFETPVTLAALGSRMHKMDDAVAGILRIASVARRA